MDIMQIYGICFHSPVALMTPIEPEPGIPPTVKDTKLLRMYLKMFGRVKIGVESSEEVYAFLCSKHGIVFGSTKDNGIADPEQLRCKKCNSG